MFRALFVALTFFSLCANAKQSPRLRHIAGTLDIIWQNGDRLQRGVDDPRSKLLVQLLNEFREFPYQIVDAEDKAEIRAKVLRLYGFFPSRGTSHNAVLALFDQLNLWTPSDFSILATLACKWESHKRYPSIFPLLLEFVDTATEREKQELTGALISVMVNSKDLGNLLMLYKLGSLPLHRYPFLIQYLGEEAISGHLLAMTEDASVFKEFHPEIARQKQRLYRENVKRLLAFATGDLHRRFKENEPLVVQSLEEIKRPRSFKMRGLSQEVRDRVAEFAEEIESGSCRRWLEP